MSRSYKHVPCCKDYNRGMKQRANRHLRRNYLDIPSGRAYKKLVEFFSSVQADFSSVEELKNAGKPHKHYVLHTLGVLFIPCFCGALWANGAQMVPKSHAGI